MSSLNGKGISESENQEITLVKTVKGRKIEADLVVRVLGQVFVKLSSISSFFFCVASPRSTTELDVRRTASLHRSDT